MTFISIFKTLSSTGEKIDLKMDEVPKNDGYGPSSINYYQPLTQNRCIFEVYI